MKSDSHLATGVSVLALATLAVLATSASAHPIYRPHASGVTPPDPNMPIVHVGPYEPPYIAPKKTKSGKWTDVENLPSFTEYGPWEPQLLTDGTVLVLDAGTQQWYKLTPDSKGIYTDGTWSKIAEMPTGDCPLYFATQILPDGRMIENGGEYNPCGSGESTAGALYDPVANSWTSVRQHRPARRHLHARRLLRQQPGAGFDQRHDRDVDRTDRLWQQQRRRLDTRARRGRPHRGRMEYRQRL
jgi:hypothetical protein